MKCGKCKVCKCSKIGTEEVQLELFDPEVTPNVTRTGIDVLQKILTDTHENGNNRMLCSIPVKRLES